MSSPLSVKSFEIVQNELSASGSARLRTQASPYSQLELDRELHMDNAQPLISLIKEAGLSCVGLALNQVAPRNKKLVDIPTPKQLFVFREFDDSNNPTDVITVAANPILRMISNETQTVTDYHEGCASIQMGKLFFSARRLLAVEIIAVGAEGEYERTLSGGASFVVQHELDHLHGVLVRDGSADTTKGLSIDKVVAEYKSRTAENPNWAFSEPYRTEISTELAKRQFADLIS